MSGFEGGLISEVPSFDGETASTVGSTLTAFGFCLAFRLGASPPRMKLRLSVYSYFLQPLITK